MRQFRTYHFSCGVLSSIFIIFAIIAKLQSESVYVSTHVFSFIRKQAYKHTS